MLENFHFIRPLWLLALIPLMLLAWRMVRPNGADNAWRRVVDARLLPLLTIGRTQTVRRTALWLLAGGWTLAVLALANPTWERKPLPLFQTTAARVIVLELSRSMNADDVKPSRLARARYKIEDVLAQSGEGQTGLVVYAGEAFTVTPLTRDVNTIRAMLPALDPGIMPSEGSRADLGLLRAGKLLSQAGAGGGSILLISDGVRADNVGASIRAAARLRDEGYRVSVLGIGAQNNVPLTNAQGELVRDAGGKIQEAGFDASTLRQVARAGGGEYRAMSDNGQALSALLKRPADAKASLRSKAAKQQWQEQGPLLAALLLPLAALAFRRNWLLSLLLLLSFAAPSRPALASGWDDLWHRQDQQAANALESGDYARAARLAKDAMRRGSAEYRRGEYQRALEAFSEAHGTDADYNRGNALAKLGRYEEAVAAYTKALKEDPGNEDAKANKAAVEALLKKQKPKPAGAQGKDARKNQGQGKSGQHSAQDKSGTQAGGQGKGAQSAKRTKGGSGSASAGAHAQADKANAAKTGGKQAAASAQQSKTAGTFADAAKKLAQKQARAAQAGAKPASTPNGRVKQQPNPTRQAKPASGLADSAQPLDSEEQMAAQQWLRRIPDDPGGLLRRKFLYQYRQRQQGRDGDG